MSVTGRYSLVEKLIKLLIVIDYVNKLTSQEVNDATKGITERRALKETG